MKTRLAIALALLNVLLVGALVAAWVDPSGNLRGVRWTAPAPIAPVFGPMPLRMPPPGDADVSRFMIILDRPLFSPTRKPAPVKAVGVADPLEGVQLFGVFTGEGGGGALVRADGKTRRLRVSESLGDWKLQEVRPREVVFARAGEQRVVALASAKGLPGAVAPPSAAPAPAASAAAPASAASSPFSAAQPVPPARATSASPAPAPAGGTSPPKSPFVIGGSR